MTPKELEQEIEAMYTCGEISEEIFMRLSEDVSAAVAAEHQRTLEQCAKVAEREGSKWIGPSDVSDAHRKSAESISAAIRALP